MTLKNIMAQILVLSAVALIFSACHKRPHHQTKTPVEAPALISRLQFNRRSRRLKAMNLLIHFYIQTYLMLTTLLHTN